MRFTDVFIKSLKPAQKKYHKSSGDGFNIRVMPSGVKTWVYLYRFDGKRKELNLGTYPDVSLATAREKHAEARKLLNHGTDPGALEREKLEARRKAPTVADLCAEYLKKHAMVHKKSWAQDERMIKAEILPSWGDRKAEDLKKRDVILLLESIMERGSPISSNNTLALVRKMFNFAIDRDILEFNPCTRVKPLAPKPEKNRVLSETEIRTLWQALDDDALLMANNTRRALRLILVTGQRPGEVTGLHIKEIEGRWWTIPPERTKNGKEHRVYLTDTALELIGDADGYVFPTRLRDRDCPMDEKALPCSLRRNIRGVEVKGKPGKKSTPNPEQPNRIGVDFFTPHDLRRTAATRMAEMGITEEIIGHVLNHTHRRTITRVYNRYAYDSEKQRALELWESRLKAIIEGAAKAEVIPLRREVG